MSDQKVRRLRVVQSALGLEVLLGEGSVIRELLEQAPNIGEHAGIEYRSSDDKVSRPASS